MKKSLESKYICLSIFLTVFIATIVYILLTPILYLLINPERVFASELSVVEFPFYTGPAVSPQGITSGPDGNIWFTETGLNKIGRITPEGVITEFTLPSIFGNPAGIVSGSDGNLWYTKTNNNIGRITTNGIIKEFTLSSNTIETRGIVARPDGNIWFVEVDYNGKYIARITPDGVITKFILPSGSNPTSITSGPDGNIWYVDNPGNKIGKITTNGTASEFNLPTSYNSPIDITSGSDGNLWFTSIGKIGRITPDFELTEFPITAGTAYTIISGPDGNMWFTESFNRIGRITPTGIITEFTLSGTHFPSLLAFGSDGNLWFTASNNIGRIGLSSNPTLTPTPTPAPTVTDFKQTDPQWSTAPDLPVNYLTRLNRSLDCGDMYGYGCAVTSTSNVFYSYGKTLLPESIQLNPGSLNDWLTDHNGFSACSIIWGSASAATELGAPTMLFRNKNNNWIAGQQVIDNALNEGNLPIVGVTTNVGTHFFVVSGKLSDLNGKPDYSIVDPALYPFIYNSPGNSGKPLSQTYGGFDKIFETVIYKKGSTPQRTLTIRGHSPIQLLITDPSGNVTGYDESTQEIMEDIPKSSYGTEPGIAPVDGQSSALHEIKYYQQIDPSEGEYIVQVIGTGNGSYMLDFSKTDEQGNVSTKIVKGFAQNDVIETYNFQYSLDATESPIINREVTFSVLKSDLKGLYSLGQIKNKGIYTLLKLEAEAAEKSSLINRQPLGNKLAILVLKTSLFQLKAQRGKQITEDAYQLIYEDVNSLIQSLQDDSSNSAS